MSTRRGWMLRCACTNEEKFVDEADSDFVPIYLNQHYGEGHRASVWPIRAAA